MSERASLGLRGSERLAARRRSKRRFIFFTLAIFIILVLGGLLWGLQQSNVRIAHVEIFGADQSLADIAFATMQGTYFGIIPRDSIFFFPASRIRAIISLWSALKLSKYGWEWMSMYKDDLRFMIQEL